MQSLLDADSTYLLSVSWQLPKDDVGAARSVVVEGSRTRNELLFAEDASSRDMIGGFPHAHAVREMLHNGGVRPASWAPPGFATTAFAPSLGQPEGCALRAKSTEVVQASKGSRQSGLR
uniref:Uncharacterized protein n=1 Tax=Phaeomonas parva TaxID=124430 RepID=A0A7S1Y1A3_9STRA|mmetsp:Transcript_9313/g.27357  ORF Transcript_9313/g.27357 Transcript_9313/m.27357 type:complete len:119 (+) Transcript_9313:622-978(+)